MRGMGRIFQRGSIYWISYYRRGKEYRESTRSDREVDAVRLLKKRIGEIRSKKFIGPQEERVTVEQLLQDFVADHQLKGRKSLPTTLEHLKGIQAAFGLDRATDVTPSRIRQVAAMWQAEGVANATINRRLGILRRAFTLAVEDEKVTSAPPLSSSGRGQTPGGIFRAR